MTIYSTCSPIIAGCFLYQDAAMTIIADNGKYSDGTNCFDVSAGEVMSITQCGTTTTTSTSSTSTTTTESYLSYYADKYECSGCTIDSNVEIAFPSSYTPDGSKWYIPPTPNGFSYKLNGGASPGPGLIMDVTPYNSCILACAVV